ncbi:MAG: 16S rRNA (guanine(527)-N(7))-methyltransferase RsmG [Acidimicrobiales bacterium]
MAEHVGHSQALARARGSWPTGPALDLGSGGGVPGLVLAVTLPETRWVLVDASHRRTAFLRAAVERLGLAGRVEVLRERAEVVGRQRRHRGRYDTVVARSFGSPAVVAECGSPLLRPGGFLVVSEPPAPVGAGRWPAEALEVLGLRVARTVVGPPAVVVVEKVAPCPARFPRRTGVPVKRPCW